MDIGKAILTAVLWIANIVAPYVMNFINKVAIMLILKSFEAAAQANTPDAKVKARKEFVDSWTSFVEDSDLTSHGTPSRYDDIMIDAFKLTTIDEDYAGKLFDIAEKQVENFHLVAPK